MEFGNVDLIQSRKNSSMLRVDGFLYYKHSESKGIVKWVCKNKKQCYAWAKTIGDKHPIILVRGGPLVSVHNHTSNLEEVLAKKIIEKIKYVAADQPEQAPAEILRCLNEVPPNVLAQLPDRQNVRKMIVRERLKVLPSNPTTLNDLAVIPDQYKYTFDGELFLLHDSNNEFGRVLVFATKENIRILMKCRTWFLDGTFDTSPTISHQVFAILGSVDQTVNGEIEELGLPLVYALMTSKEVDAYTTVLEAVLLEAEKLGLTSRPQFLMTDFEKATLNACHKVFPMSSIKACFFHLKQSLFRRIQTEGLQKLYDDENDRSIKNAYNMMTGLAFVPDQDVEECFDAFAEKADEIFDPILDYFEVNYIRGRKARGKRKAVDPRYPVQLWNVYSSVVNDVARINNISEGWHNRFRVVVGKSYPSFYAFLNEIKKEQADTETILLQISLGELVREPRSNAQKRLEKRIKNIVSHYQNYKDNDSIIDYLQNIGYNL